MLTPITKSFPAEKGFEANALALQIHGGYGFLDVKPGWLGPAGRARVAPSKAGLVFSRKRQPSALQSDARRSTREG